MADRTADGTTLEPARIDDRVILVRINRLYRPGMSDDELYETTRAAWRVGPRREAAEYALAVFRGEVLEVYRIEQWQPARVTRYDAQGTMHVAPPDRWEFIGHVANESVRGRYVGRSVREYLRRGHQSPIVYVHC